MLACVDGHNPKDRVQISSKIKEILRARAAFPRSGPENHLTKRGDRAGGGAQTIFGFQIKTILGSPNSSGSHTVDRSTRTRSARRTALAIVAMLPLTSTSEPHGAAHIYRKLSRRRTRLAAVCTMQRASQSVRLGQVCSCSPNAAAEGTTGSSCVTCPRHVRPLLRQAAPVIAASTPRPHGADMRARRSPPAGFKEPAWRQRCSPR